MTALYLGRRRLEWRRISSTLAPTSAALGLYRMLQHFFATAGDVYVVHCRRGVFVLGAPKRSQH